MTDSGQPPRGPWAYGPQYPPGQPPPPFPPPQVPPQLMAPRPIPPMPPAPVTAILGRISCFVGIAAAVVACVIWCFVGAMSVAAGPLCTECMAGWLPPVAIGIVGPILPVMLWTVALIAQWRHPLLLVWSLVGWPILGGTNIWAIESFAALFSQ